MSNSVDFAVRRLNITLLTPAVRTATSAGFALTVTGTGFLPGATVEFGGISLNPIGTTASSSSLSVNVPASALVQAGTIQVSVTNPNRQVSNSLPFVIRPVPVIESTSPKPIPVGSAPLTLTVTGTNFFAGVVLQWNGQGLSTAFQSATQLTVGVPANLLTQLGSAVLTVITPDVVISAPYIQPIGSVTTNVPVLTVGDGPVTIVITGTGFGPNPGVQFSCPPAALATLVTTSGSNTLVTAVIPANLLLQAGTCQIIVIGSNGPIIVDVPVNPRPQISTLSQNNSPAGGTAPLTLLVSGTGFEPGSVVRWNGAPLATTPATGGLQAIVPVTLLATPGSVTITVVGPRGSTSNGVPFTISLPPVSLQLTVPPATTPSKDETVTLGLGAAFPVDLVGTLTLTFKGDGTLPDDPAIQFSNNSRTLPINIPAGTRPAINAIFKTGTIAGVITLTPQFTSGGVAVTGTGLGPQTLTVPRIAPVLTAVTCTRASGAFNVVSDGYTNTRQATQAQFTFTGDNLGTASLGVDATAAFNTWAAGNSPGGTFRYTQAFNVQGNVNAITTVAVRLTNSVGQSAERSASCQ